MNTNTKAYCVEPLCQKEIKCGRTCGTFKAYKFKSIHICRCTFCYILLLSSSKYENKPIENYKEFVKDFIDKCKPVLDEDELKLLVSFMI